MRFEPRECRGFATRDDRFRRWLEGPGSGARYPLVPCQIGVEVPPCDHGEP